MRYITQFNEFVFQRAVEDDSSTAFRDDIIEYTNKHGGYSPGKDYLEVGRLSITITLYPNELSCDARPFYRDFFISQLKPGKLWAVQDGVLLWTHAKVVNVTPVKGKLEFDVEFRLLDGYWHKADLQRTFLKPWDVCAFMDCHNFKTIQPCKDDLENCCECVEIHPIGCDCCDCLGITEDMALCYRLDDVKNFDPCVPTFEAIYSCEDKFFDEYGQKICGTCGVIAGSFYSNTDIDTDGVTIRFKGKVKNPYIEINGNGNQIKGEYHDLVIYPDGTVYANCMFCELSADDWVVPIGNEYGWTVHQGNNRVLVENCCGAVCVWIQADARTI